VYDLVEEGIGVVWSTAYLDEAERCAGVLLFNAGQLLYEGPPRRLTRRVEGRTFLARGSGRNRRAVLAGALARPEVLDGVVQGRSIRVVVREGASPPKPTDLGISSGEVTPPPPRFEDAFVYLLGGAPRGESQLAGAGRPAGGEEAVVEANGLTRRFGDFTA